MKNWHTGLSKHPLYSTYYGMVVRCKYPSSSNYKNYGGRGIKVCKRWLGEDGFTHFITDMGDKPSQHHTLDRINNDGDYTPENCRWATRKEQMQTARPRGDNSRNTSGIRGIHFDISKMSWRGSFTVKGKRYFTRYFKSRADAIQAKHKLMEELK